MHFLNIKGKRYSRILPDLIPWDPPIASIFDLTVVAKWGCKDLLCYKYYREVGTTLFLIYSLITCLVMPNTQA